ncbi:hypothetical protein ACFYYL_09115 [Actinomadura geliboluensis]|uniref:hypothetical protein n=1 Tax=Actinomadura geliboluensis TaxID=882440 RepID=UPI0036C98DE2
MRYTRVIPPVALLLTLPTACTHTEAPTFNPTPHPTHPAQAVVIAGSPDDYRPPRDGDYAVRSSAQSDGGLTVDPSTGLTYYRTAGSADPRIARIERDGRLTTFRVRNPGDQLAIAAGELWIMSAAKALRLSKISLAGLREQDVLPSEGGRTPQITAPSGRPLAPGRQRQMNRAWEGARFAIRGDGVPVIVTRGGELFEVAGAGRLRQWTPAGYEAAVRKVAGTGELRPRDAAADERRGLVVLGVRGLVHVRAERAASAVRFPASTEKSPPWSAVAPLPGGSALLLGGTSAFQREPRPVLVRPDGTLELLAFGGPAWCDQFDGTLAAVASAEPGGLARAPDGSYVLSDKNCGRIYRFRLPENLSGSTYRG